MNNKTWEDATCFWCKIDFKRRISLKKGKHVFCSRECSLNNRTKDSIHRKIREYIENSQFEDLILFLDKSTDKTDKGCWINLMDKKERPRYYDKNGKFQDVHRLVVKITTKIDMPEMQVHHKCADRRCINPKHLQYTSAQENTAEMMERKRYIERIIVLEETLRNLDPLNGLLKEWGQSGIK